MAKCLVMLASPKKKERNIICQHRLAHTVGAFTKLAQAHATRICQILHFQKMFVCLCQKHVFEGIYTTKLGFLSKKSK